MEVYFQLLCVLNFIRAFHKKFMLLYRYYERVMRCMNLRILHFS